MPTFRAVSSWPKDEFCRMAGDLVVDRGEGGQESRNGVKEGL